MPSPPSSTSPPLNTPSAVASEAVAIRERVRKLGETSQGVSGGVVIIFFWGGGN